MTPAAMPPFAAEESPSCPCDVEAVVVFVVFPDLEKGISHASMLKDRIFSSSPKSAHAFNSARIASLLHQTSEYIVTTNR